MDKGMCTLSQLYSSSAAVCKNVKRTTLILNKKPYLWPDKWYKKKKKKKEFVDDNLSSNEADRVNIIVKKYSKVLFEEEKRACVSKNCAK